MTDYSIEASEGYNYNTSSEGGILTCFPLDFPSNNSKVCNILIRVKRSYEKLWAACGGINNLVFYKSSEEIFSEVKCIHPIYAAEVFNDFVTETVFKVKDLALVEEQYKTQVEVIEEGEK